MTLENPEHPISPQQAAINAGEKTTEHSDKPAPPSLPSFTKPHLPPTSHKREITCNTKRDWIDKMTLGFEGFGLVVLIIYTITTVLLWRTAHNTLVEGRQATADQLSRLDSYVTEAKKANTISLAANRPWIGTVQAPPGTSSKEFTFDEGFDSLGIFIAARYVWDFKNGGKRAAKVEKIRTTGNWSHTCTDKPNYDFLPPGTIKAPAIPHDSRALIIPDAGIKSVFQTPIPIEKWNLIKGGKLQYCIYTLIEYRDVGGDQSVIHHTTDCRTLVMTTNLIAFAECENNYANAD